MAYGYKVVRNDRHGHLQSAFELGRVRRYSTKKTTNRIEGDGPFAVFVKKEDALRFPCSAGRIFRCRYTRTKGERALWTKEHRFEVSSRYPKGTDFADKVLLLYEVG